jgi:hypothetical protein
MLHFFRLFGFIKSESLNEKIFFNKNDIKY